MDHYTRSARNHFTAYALNRGHTPDEAEYQTRLMAPGSRFLMIWQTQHLVTEDTPPRPVLLTPEEAAPWIKTAVSLTLLGDAEELTYFAVDLPSDAAAEALTQRGRFVGLREMAMMAGHFDGGLLAYAQAMAHWHRQHRFCSACGRPTGSATGGHIRRCTNPACGQSHFPRTDPAIIVRVTWGQSPQDQILLGRQSQWPKGRHSTLAGFVSPGESMEDAVLREVQEETGVRVHNIHYHSSQPWPFPQSLMIGFTAEATTPELCEGLACTDGELEDARWFTRSDIRQGLASGIFSLPAPISIAFHLIEDWFDEGTEGRLRDLLLDKNM